MRRLSPLHRRPRPCQLQAPLGVLVSTRPEQIERPTGLADRLRERADVERTIGRSAEQGDGAVRDVVGNAVDRADVADELGRRCGVVGDLIDRAELEAAHHGRRPGVALRPRRLRQRLIGNLTDHVRAEPPPPIVDIEHPDVDELVEIARIERLAHLDTEPLQRAQRTRRPEHRGVVDHLPLPGWEACRAARRSAPAASPEGPRGRADPERPRRAGSGRADCRRSARRAGRPDRPRRDRRAPQASSSSDSGRLNGSSGIRIMIGWSCAGGQSISASSRCAVISSTGRSTSERVSRPSSSSSSGSAHCRSSIQTTTGACCERRWTPSTTTCMRISRACPGRNAIEFGRMAEEMECPLDEALESRDRPRRSRTARAPAPRRAHGAGRRGHHDRRPSV